MKLFEFKDKVAVIAGASSGLGADAARAFSEHGASVVVMARRRDKLDQLVEEINGQYIDKAYAVTCDVSDEESVKKAVAEIVGKYGKIDILFNNAGIAVGGGVDTLTDDQWDNMFNVNIKGITHVSKHVIPIMKEKGYGRIINTASINALIADKAEPLWRHAYNVTKAGVIGLTKGMAASYSQFGITTNALCPGLFESEMTENTLFKSPDFLTKYNALCPAGRPGNRGELNGPLLFFASEGSSYVTGQYLLVDGGISIT